MNELTPDYIAKMADPLWRLENLYKIIDKQRNFIRFTPNKIQRLINNSKAKRKIILKARQFGVTTNEMLKLLDKAVWGQNQNICILAHDQDTIKKIFTIIRKAYDSMPEFLKPELDKGGGSAYELRFPKRQNTIFVALQVRGGTNHILHISEGAFIPEERIIATLETVPKDGEVTYESTPNGLNHYYDLWMMDSDRYEKHFYPWYLHEEYNLATPKLKEYSPEEINLKKKALHFGVELSDGQVAFRRAKIQDIKSKFYQEYPEDDQSCFLASGHNPFDTMILKTNLESCHAPVQVDQKIKIWKPVETGKNYIIGADPAEGVKSDYSAASVICVENKEQVALFKEFSKPSEFAEILAYIGKLYTSRSKAPMIVCERNNHGHAVILKLREELRYPALWLDTDERIGHRTTILSRPILLDTFIEAVESGMFKINSREILSECLTLVDNNGKIEAEDGKHDDTIIATALAIKVALERLPKLNIYKNARKSILV